MPIIPTTLSVRTYHMVKDYFKEKDLEGSKLMCFFSMTDLRKNMHHVIMEELYEDKKFFQNYIPYLSDVEKMGIHRQPIEEYARSSYAARCYHLPGRRWVPGELVVEVDEGVLVSDVEEQPATASSATAPTATRECIFMARVLFRVTPNRRGGVNVARRGGSPTWKERRVRRCSAP